MSKLSVVYTHFSDTIITAKGWTSFIYILKGSVSLGSQPTSYDAFNTLVLTANDTETGVSLTATADNTEFVLVGFSHSFSLCKLLTHSLGRGRAS